jgi:hypothetical protein
MTSQEKTNQGYILLSTEVELYVKALQTFTIEEVASKRFYRIIKNHKIY